MHRALFSSWKFALLWAIGISASVAAFFADGGGHEQLEQSAQQIRDKRSNPYRKDAEPEVQPTAATPAPAPEAEPEEPAFGEPMSDEFGNENVPPPKPGQQPSAEAAESF